MPQREQKRVRESPEVRRQQILDAAIEIIGRKGYQGFTIQELARGCGLTNGGMLYYFGSKEQLLVAILEERDRRDSRILPETLVFEAGEEALPLRMTIKIFRAIIERSVAQPEIMRLYAVLQAEALNHAHPAHDYFLGREAMVLDRFSEMLEPHIAEPRIVARQLLALLDGLAQQWLRVDGAFDLIAAWDVAIANIFPEAGRRALEAASKNMASPSMT